jgi:hypothetical protein
MVAVPGGGGSVGGASRIGSYWNVRKRTVDLGSVHEGLNPFGGVQLESIGLCTPRASSTAPLCQRLRCASDAATLGGTLPSLSRKRSVSSPW